MNSGDETIRIPVEAVYRVIDGRASLVSAAYADVPAAEIAKRILTLFGSPIKQDQEVNQ